MPKCRVEQWALPLALAIFVKSYHINLFALRKLGSSQVISPHIEMELYLQARTVLADQLQSHASSYSTFLQRADPILYPGRSGLLA